MPNEPDPRPVRKDNRQFGARYLLRNALLAVPAAVALWIGMTAAGPTRWIAVAVFACLLAGWIVADRALFRRFQCPQCEAAIRKPTRLNRSPGDPILYYCPTCRIEWDTRLRESGEL